MKLGKLGVWSGTDGMSAADAAQFARRVEQWGYGALWLPESSGRNAPVHVAWLLAHTTRLVVATGIANIYARDAQAAASAQAALNEQSQGRFLLGLGVSHVPLVEGLRGHHYGKPVASMRAYLEAMRRTKYEAPPPPEKPKTVLAALGPKMLELARDLADGAHPYLVSPAHTAQARAILGPDKWLCPEQKVLLQSDPATARAVARQTVVRYLQLVNYRNNLVRLGFGEADFTDGGSNRLVDALVAWGDESAIRARLQEHWDAGADHVCIQPLDPSGSRSRLPDEKVLALLAPGSSGS